MAPHNGVRMPPAVVAEMGRYARAQGWVTESGQANMSAVVAAAIDNLPAISTGWRPPVVPGAKTRVDFRLSDQRRAAVEARARDECLLNEDGEPNRSAVVRIAVGYLLHQWAEANR